MPYPNQHACRIKEPSSFKKGSFRTLHTKQKGLSLIVGELKSSGKSATQAFRYAKTDWTADRARKHCSSHQGRFDAASTRKQLSLEENGKDYLLMTEITPEIIKEIKIDFLYRTHTALHSEMIRTDLSEELELAHEVVAKELEGRGFLHHQWDKLDSNYLQKKNVV